MPKIAINFSNSTFSFATDGRAATSAPISEAMDITSVLLGENFNGTIRNIRFFPTAKTDSEVVQISLGSIAPGINDTLQINAAGDTLQINAAGDTLRIN